MAVEEVNDCAEVLGSAELTGEGDGIELAALGELAGVGGIDAGGEALEIANSDRAAVADAEDVAVGSSVEAAQSPLEATDGGGGGNRSVPDCGNPTSEVGCSTEAAATCAARTLAVRRAAPVYPLPCLSL